VPLDVFINHLRQIIYHHVPLTQMLNIAANKVRVNVAEHCVEEYPYLQSFHYFRSVHLFKENVEK
jgi:hypothetical protein